MDIVKAFLDDYAAVCVAMAVLIFFVTEVLKIPIKLVTKHIENERTRRIANSVILLIPFGLGVLLDYLYSGYIGSSPSILTGLAYGSSGISVYGAVERFFKVKVNNPYDSQEGEDIIELVETISEDGKVDADDMSAVSDFLKKVK